MAYRIQLEKARLLRFRFFIQKEEQASALHAQAAILKSIEHRLNVIPLRKSTQTLH